MNLLEYPCMMCGGMGDVWETEDRYEYKTRQRIWWTYCRTCDCWTEHVMKEEKKCNTQS